MMPWIWFVLAAFVVLGFATWLYDYLTNQIVWLLAITTKVSVCTIVRVLPSALLLVVSGFGLAAGCI